MFWYLLNRSGLLDEVEIDLKSDTLLKNIYDKRFVQKYALNFVNVVNRPTIYVTQLKKGEEQAGIRFRVTTKDNTGIASATIMAIDSQERNRS